MIRRIVSVGSMLALSSSFALAELKSIDDSQLADVTGRAGITIDIDMGVEIGEFMYQDAGSVVMQGIRMGGMDRGSEVGTLFDGSVGIVDYAADCPSTGTAPSSNNSCGTTGLNNVRIEVDIAGDGSTQGKLAGTDINTGQPIYFNDNRFTWAWGEFINPLQGGALGCGQGGIGLETGCRFTADDGDLFIHAAPIAAADTNPVGFDSGGAGGVAGSAAGVGGTALVIADYGFEMDRFALKDSTYSAGDDCDSSGCGGTSSAQSTTIISDLRVEGFFGGFDLLIENDGNNFGADGSTNYIDQLVNGANANSGNADSKIKINSFFKITEMEYDFDIVGIRYEGIRMGNTRGNLLMFDMFTQEDYVGAPASIGTTQSFAQSATHIYAVKDNVLRVGSPAGVNGGTNSANYVDGITLESRLVADMDIMHLSFGDTDQSIGELYYTDMDYKTFLTISAH